MWFEAGVRSENGAREAAARLLRFGDIDESSLIMLRFC